MNSKFCMNVYYEQCGGNENVLVMEFFTGTVKTERTPKSS